MFMCDTRLHHNSINWSIKKDSGNSQFPYLKVAIVFAFQMYTIIFTFGDHSNSLAPSLPASFSPLFRSSIYDNAPLKRYQNQIRLEFNCRILRESASVWMNLKFLEFNFNADELSRTFVYLAHLFNYLSKPLSLLRVAELRTFLPIKPFLNRNQLVSDYKFT